MPKQPTFRMVRKTKESVEGPEWGWLDTAGQLWFVPNSGGQHEKVALKLCEMFRLASSTVMEQLGWIRVDQADVRARHLCGETGCMTQAQYDFLSRAYSRLGGNLDDICADGTSVRDHKDSFRRLLAHATIRDPDSTTCETKSGLVVITQVADPRHLGWRLK